MAIIKFGPTIVGARGTIAGTTFSANKAGPFARGWSRGSNPASTLQSNHRNALSAQAAAWRDLTAAEQIDWNDYADDPAQELTNSLGETYFVSGFNWFVTINLHLLQAGDAVRVDAPTVARPIAPTIVSWRVRTTAGGSNTRLQFDTMEADFSDSKAVFVRLFTSLGRTAAAANFSFMTNESPDVGGFVIFQDEIEAVFGNIPGDAIAFVQVFNQDDQGQRSPVSTDSTVTEA